MRRFWMALTFVSVLVMAQGVVAVEPMPNPVEIGLSVDADVNAIPAPHVSASLSTGPDAVTAALLLIGIWGLAIVGTRVDPDREIRGA